MRITLNVKSDSTETHIEASDPERVVAQLQQAITALHAEIDEYKNCAYHGATDDFPYPASPEYYARKRYEHMTEKDVMLTTSYPTWEELSVGKKAFWYGN